jgi:hypothetical protein
LCSVLNATRIHLESIGITDDPAQDDEQVAEQLVEQSIRQKEDGQYIVQWPKCDPHPPLHLNFNISYRRMLSQVARLNGQPEQLEKYHGSIKEQESLGIIEEVRRNSEGLEHYLPHHAVICESSTTPAHT